MDQSPAQPQAASDMNGIDPNLIKAIVGALLETAPMQWVIQQQQAQEAAASAAPGAGEPDGDEMAPAADVPPPDVTEGSDDGMGDNTGADVPPPDMGDDMGDEQPGDNAPDVMDEDVPPADDGMGDEAAPDETLGDEPGPDAGNDVGPDDESDMDDEEAQHYAALPPAYRPHYLRGRRSWKKKYAADMGGGAAMYSRGRNGADASVAATIDELQKQVNTLTRQNRYSARHVELEKLAADYAFKLEDEFAETRDYEPAQWANHVTRIKTRYSRRANPMGIPTLPTPALDKPAPKAREGRSGVDKYSVRAREIIDRHFSVKGAKPLTYDDAMEKARKEIDGK